MDGKAMKSIKRKLVVSNILFVLLVLIVLTTIAAWNGEHLIRQFTIKMKHFSSNMIEDLKDASQYSQEEVVRIYSNQAEKKGWNLIAKDSLALTTPFIENQILFIQDFVKKSYDTDTSVVHAAFYSLDLNKLRPIMIANNQFPKGVIADLTYKDEHWIAKDANRSIYDPNLNNLVQDSKPVVRFLENYTLTNKDGKSKTIQAYDVFTPILDGKHDDIKELISEGESIGFLRYIISLEQTNKIVDKTNARLVSLISKQVERANESQLEIINMGSSSRKNLLSLLVITALVVFSLGFITSQVVAKKFTLPILKLSGYAREIAKGNYEKEVSIDSNDEIGQLGIVFNEMRMRIKSFTEQLQMLVEEKTAQQKATLNSVTQAILTIDENLNITPEYSKYSEVIFSKSDLTNANIDDLIFKRSSLSGDEIEYTKECLKACFGGIASICWGSNELPQRVDLSTKDGFQNLMIEWSPILADANNPDSEIKGVVASIRDITDELLLREQLRINDHKNKEMMNAIAMLVSAKKETAVRGFLDGKSRINDILTNARKGHLNLESCNTSLHTMKGVFRTINFSDIADIIHTCESLIKKQSKSALNTEIISKLHDIDNIMNYYIGIMEDKLGWNLYDSDTSNETLHDISSEFIKSVKDRLLNSRLRFKRMSCDDGIMSWDSKYMITLRSQIIHLLTNSVDHGYLLQKKDKTSLITRGIEIEVSSYFKDDNIVIDVRDYGGGFDTDLIIDKARRVGLIDNTFEGNPISLIFENGFSTSDNVSLTSGRGIGLSSVKEAIAKIGGALEAHNTSNGSLIRITLPISEPQASCMVS